MDGKDLLSNGVAGAYYEIIRSMPARKRAPLASYRLDSAALFAALDAERLRCNMTLEAVAAELDVHHSTMAVWRHGGGMRADVALRAALWLEIDLRDFAVLPAAQGAAA